MNVSDVKDFSYPGNAALKIIFKEQFALMKRYSEIEKTNDLVSEDNLKTNLDTLSGQALIKDFSSRVWEEISESVESLTNEDSIEHYYEELADACLFAIEMFILAGYSHKDFQNFDEIMKKETVIQDKKIIFDKMFESLYFLGLSRNCLKNKKWKATQMMTDRIKYKQLLDKFWFSFLELFFVSGLAPEKIFNYYMKKVTVNRWRIASNY